jgi:2-phosphosulfolactate phosphatase
VSRPGGPGAGVLFEWGRPGAQATGGPASALVIVDVLSFSTAVTIAVGHGAAVYPHPWPAPDIKAFADVRDAALAVPRHQARPDQPWSLSPASLLSGPLTPRLVLPSPSGSAIAAASRHVLAGCLRNATAVARWLEHYGYGTASRPAVIIAAGERWPGGDLRPALEDLLGAGAIIAALSPDRTRTAEAAAAEVLWRACREHAGEFLAGCTSGQELTAAGYAGDVALAAEHDIQAVVPVLTGSAFLNHVPPRGQG